jgi:hypothetical protein
MSLPDTIFTALGPLVGDRCYPTVFPLRNGALPEWPAIRYSLVSEDASATICGTGEDDETDDVRVQIDAVDRTYSGMRTLKASIRAAMNAITEPPCRHDGGLEMFDDETKTHRAMMQYVFTPSSD